ncbi:unnamed protein product [Phytomonas sp. Hart1]|nr:unnamed protein product [Phytomonas sp. Hart1]|eukprot:CCW71231.1 unnamed protein product [Phytomonas sp. isolate Hart1]
MWIIYFNATPHFWLSGGKVYRIGKKECDITIKDDPSISRTHLSFEIGLSPLQHIAKGNSSSQINAVSPQNNKTDCGSHFTSLDAQNTACDAPAAITLIDSSTYGSTAIALGCETNASGLEKSLATASVFQYSALGIASLPPQTHVATEACNKVSSSVVKPKPTMVLLNNAANVGREQHRIVKGVPFHVPLDRVNWRRFALVLGNHGATLVFAWEDLHVLIENIKEYQHTNLEGELNHCGMKLLASSNSHGYCTDALARADLLVSSFSEPTPCVLAMLCRMVPVVLPSFFTDTLNRVTPQVPLPNLCSYLPPTSPAWRHFVPSADFLELGKKNNSSIPISPDFLKPNSQRKDLFAGFTFVVLRQTLLNEIAFFVECAKGSVVLDDTLKKQSNGSIAQDDLFFFTAHHKGHIIVIKKVEKDALEEYMIALNNKNLVRCIDYDILVRCVVLAEPLSQIICQDFSSGLFMSLTEKDKGAISVDVPSGRSSSNVRKTETIPVFSSLNSLEEKADVGYERVSSTITSDTERFVDTHGWISRRNPGNSTADRSETLYNHDPHFEISTMAGHVTSHKRTRDELGDTWASPDHTGELSWNKLELQPYPCFQAYHSEDTSTTTAPTPYLAPRQFSKQYVEATSCPPAELDMSFLGASEMDGLSSRVLDLSTSDIIPDRRSIARNLADGRGSVQHSSSLQNFEVMAVGGVATVVKAFNTFDTAAHNSVNKKRATVARKRIQTDRSRNGAGNMNHTVRTSDAGTDYQPFSSFLSTSHEACNKPDTLERVDNNFHKPENPSSTHSVFPIGSTHTDFDIFDIEGIF